MGDILALKLIIGEEIVGEVLDVIRSQSRMLQEAAAAGHEDGDIIAYKLRRPHVLRFLQTAQGANLAFIPWTLCNPTIEVMTVPASAVLLTFPPSANVEKQYIEQTSGIALASPGSRISK